MRSQPTPPRTDLTHLRRIAAIGSLLALAGCGTYPADRITGAALGGAAIGAGIGALGGGVGAAAGAGIGAGIGAIGAAVTSPRQIDLGAPPWGGSAASDAHPAEQPPQPPPPSPHP